jgi:RNA polymerase sigma-70 factor (family 1)
MQTISTYEEQELLKRLAAGDEEGFAAIYAQYAEPLMDFAAARLSSLAEAEDIVQDLFVHLWKERSNISIEVSLRAFLFAAVRYRVINHIRRNIVHEKYAHAVKSLQAAPVSQEEIIQAKQLEEKLLQAVSQLPEKPALVFKMRRYENKTIAEIAKELGVSEKTVKNQLTTALNHLRAVLGKLVFLIWWM